MVKHESVDSVKQYLCELFYQRQFDMFELESFTSGGGRVDYQQIDVVFTHSSFDKNRYCFHLMIFFTEQIGGCSCGDAPCCIPNMQEFVVFYHIESKSVSVVSDA